MSNIPCDKEKVNEMKLHMLMLMNAWMMLMLMKCKCEMQCLTLRCYSELRRWQDDPLVDVAAVQEGVSGDHYNE